MSDHVCACDECDPEVKALLDQWTAPNHYSVAKGDFGTVLLNGQDVSLDAMTCITGAEGKVLMIRRTDGHAHVCSCGQGACVEIRTGAVVFNRGSS